jgi:hypothetical protein
VRDLHARGHAEGSQGALIEPVVRAMRRPLRSARGPFRNGRLRRIYASEAGRFSQGVHDRMLLSVMRGIAHRIRCAKSRLP